MASFCAVLVPLDVLDEIWDLIESVSEGFLTFSNKTLCYIIVIGICPGLRLMRNLFKRSVPVPVSVKTSDATCIVLPYHWYSDG